MNKEMQKLLKAINDKKNEVKSLVNDGKLDKAKAAMIITDKADEISQALSDSYGLGLTHIPGKGFYNDTELTVIYFVVNRFQISRLKDIVMSIDADAFVTITEVTDVYGSSLRDDE